MIFQKKYEKTVWGYAMVDAKDKEEAEQMFDEWYFDEFENNSDYQWDDEITSAE